MQTTLTAKRQLDQAKKIDQLTSTASQHVTRFKTYLSEKKHEDHKIMNAMMNLIIAFDSSRKKTARREFVAKAFGAFVVVIMAFVFAIIILYQYIRGEEMTAFSNTNGNTIVIVMNIAILLGWLCYKQIYRFSKSCIQAICRSRVSFEEETEETDDIEKALSTVSEVVKSPDRLTTAFSNSSIPSQEPSMVSPRVAPLPGAVPDRKEATKNPIVVPQKDKH